jgi:hypothetical protein
MKCGRKSTTLLTKLAYLPSKNELITLESRNRLKKLHMAINLLKEEKVWMIIICFLKITKRSR